MKGRDVRKLASPRWLLLGLVAALGLAAASVAGASGTAPASANGTAPASAKRSTACPFKSGQIRIFMAQDTKAAIGDEIAPAGVRMVGVWVDDVNKRGGILGCKVTYQVKDETFGDIPACLRVYRDAIASKKFDVYWGPTNSACMAALTDLTKAANLPLVTGIAADHQPYMEKFSPNNFHPSVSTFLEGRASAVAAKKIGWRTAAVMVPNYAYGQDVGKSFNEYFERIVSGGKVTNEQFPEFNETNFTPFINAMVAAKPSGVISAFFGPFVVPFLKQWKASGNDKRIDLISGNTILATFAVAKTDDVPDKTWGFDRAEWHVMQSTPAGAKLARLYLAKYGKDHPVVSEFAYQLVSAGLFTKAIIEATKSLDWKVWKTRVEKGDFGFLGPYHKKLTYVNPVNHMADGCTVVGRIIATPGKTPSVQYDVNTFIKSCMHDILDAKEAKQLTNNPGVSDAALATYTKLADAS